MKRKAPSARICSGLSNRRGNYFHFGKDNGNWKGGKRIDRGYVLIYMPQHPFATDSYIREHRLAMEKYLGRYLKPTEIVHHKNGIKNDNRIKNLELISSITHNLYHCAKSLPFYVRRLLTENRKLKKEIKTLKRKLNVAQKGIHIKFEKHKPINPTEIIFSGKRMEV